MIVYKITNKANNKVYIGITIRSLQERWNEHRSRIEERRHCHLYAAMLQYGIENFVIEQIDSALTKEELYKKEQYYISYYDSQNPAKGYNMTAGGDTLKAIDLDEEYIIYLYTIEKRSTAEIAKILKVSSNTIRRRLIKNNIKPNWSSAVKLTEEDDNNIIKLRKLGKTIKEIANIYSVNDSTIRRHLYKYNMN